MVIQGHCRDAVLIAFQFEMEVVLHMLVVRALVLGRRYGSFGMVAEYATVRVVRREYSSRSLPSRWYCQVNPSNLGNNGLMLRGGRNRVQEDSRSKGRIREEDIGRTNGRCVGVMYHRAGKMRDRAQMLGFVIRCWAVMVMMRPGRFFGSEVVHCHSLVSP